MKVDIKFSLVLTARKASDWAVAGNSAVLLPVVLQITCQTCLESDIYIQLGTYFNLVPCTIFIQLWERLAISMPALKEPHRQGADGAKLDVFSANGC